MENLSKFFQKKITHRENEFYNSIQDKVFTTTDDR